MATRNRTSLVRAISRTASIRGSALEMGRHAIVLGMAVGREVGLGGGLAGKPAPLRGGCMCPLIQQLRRASAASALALSAARVVARLGERACRSGRVSRPVVNTITRVGWRSGAATRRPVLVVPKQPDRQALSVRCGPRDGRRRGCGEWALPHPASVVLHSAPAHGDGRLDPRFIDDLARRLSAAVPPGVTALRRDLEDNFKAVLQAGLTRLDLVSRQEFDVQSAVLRRKREKLEALEARVAALESGTTTVGSEKGV